MHEDVQVDDVNVQLSAYEAGELSDAAQTAVRALLERQDERGQEARRVLARLRRLRQATAGLATLVLPAARQQALGERVFHTVRAGRARRQRLGIAAGVSLLAVAAVALWFVRRPPPPDLQAFAGTHLRTGAGDFQLLPIGERAVAFVGEDTELWSTPGATPALRVVRGSVRLMVRRRPNEPFVVNTPAADVEVLGTEFDVSVVQGETEVKVVRGVVAVRNPHGQQRLWARESALARLGQAPRQLVPVRGVVIEGVPEVNSPPP